MNPLNQKRRALKEDSKRFPDSLLEVSRSEWPRHLIGTPAEPVRSWRSRKFFGMLYRDRDFDRLSFGRSDLDGAGEWKDGLTWDELMTLKREAGFGDRFAIELYPADSAIVNVANLRHLWLLDSPPPQSWRGGK
jgi:hypothetical protein